MAASIASPITTAPPRPLVTQLSEAELDLKLKEQKRIEKTKNKALQEELDRQLQSLRVAYTSFTANAERDLAALEQQLRQHLQAQQETHDRLKGELLAEMERLKKRQTQLNENVHKLEAKSWQ